ncbi:AraC family transcriptional regulator [Amycolatopsis thermophila]|uniref:AraC-like DNA-binding protein n=1 Tax=Amycolatopsis thermophila TaxID=206084 RepID=A0ABU0F299_9PSEU|nr:AraC family transcriptional regulator [Amycolatopsis thermophila]MDQ0381706.1 AraC-like DNA-binding protein [Amycolatopsis thermophila]
MTDRVEHRYGPENIRLVTASFRGHHFVPHTHSEYAIAVVERGVEAVRYRGVTEHAPAGSLLLLDADTVHAGRPAVAEGWDYRVFYVPPELLAELAGHRPRFTTPTPHDPDLTARLTGLHRDPALDTLEEAFSLVLARYSSTAPDEADAPAVVRRVRRALHADLHHTPSLEELAEFAGMPRFQLLRAFRRETGLTPHGYLRQLRLRHAQQLLTAGHTVARAAAESGFHDQSHLHRHFRRTFGGTPGSFARNDVQGGRRCDS